MRVSVFGAGELSRWPLARVWVFETAHSASSCAPVSLGGRSVGDPVRVFWSCGEVSSGRACRSQRAREEGGVSKGSFLLSCALRPQVLLTKLQHLDGPCSCSLSYFTVGSAEALR